MKIKIVMKDADTIGDAVLDAVTQDVAWRSLSTSERQSLIVRRTRATQELLSKWFQHGEYLGIEVDTDTMTARVLEASEI